MTVTVVLTDELAARVERVAAERGVEPDELAREVLAANVPAPAAGRHRFGFVGLGASGDGHLSENYKAIRRAEFGS